LQGTHCAIVSANAFDKALDNDVGIRPEDFIVKPVRHSELLDWIGQRLQLTWLDGASSPPPTAAPPAAPAVALPLCYPHAAARAALAEGVALGYYRGIMTTLDQIERQQPECQPLVQQMRDLARQFQFDAIHQLLQQAPP